MDNKTNRIGVIGAGHLGLSIAKSLINNTFDNSLTYLSYHGSSETLKRITEANLLANITSTEEIATNSNIIIIAIRPSSLYSLASLKFNPKATVISCIAGIQCQKLQNIINHEIIRIMPSSPMTIENHKGICAVYPNNDIANYILSALNIAVFLLPNESYFHIFTATVCLPAAYLQMELLGIKSFDNLNDLYSNELPFWNQLIAWSYSITPKNLSAIDKVRYIDRMATKGGITESIVNSIKNGNNIIDSFKNGINRSIEISKS